MRRSFIVTLGMAALMAGCAAPPQDAPQAAALDAAPVAEPAPEPAPAPAPVAPAPAPAAPAPARRPAATPASNVSPAAPAPAPAAPRPALPEYREITVAAGTALALRLTTPVASDSSQVEDAVRASLREAVVVNGDMVIPAGTQLVGHVTDAERSGRVRGRARVAFQFTRLAHDGDQYEIRSEVVERIAEATKGEDAAKVGIGAGAGAALGALLGGGSGAAKGAAIGAAAGTGAVLVTRGEEVRLEPGESVDTRLTVPLTFRVRVR